MPLSAPIVAGGKKVLLLEVASSLSTGSPVGCPNLTYRQREQVDNAAITIRVADIKGIL